MGKIINDTWGKDKYWERDKRRGRETKTGWGGARQCQEARDDRTITFTDVPPRVKVWSRGAGRLSGPHCSQLKQCQPGGFQLGGGYHCVPSWLGRPPWNSSPLHARPRSQVSSVLWQRWNEGLLRGHEGNTPTTHSAGTEAKKKGKERGRGGRKHRQQLLRAVAS